MAAPTYSEDLTDIDLAEPASTGWTAFNISGGGGGAPAFGADLGMQGLGCWDKPCSNAERGLAVNKTPGAGTVAAGVHIFVWGFCATPGITDNLATRGAYVLIGTGTSDYVQFHVEGNDTYGAGGRVGKCYVVDYVTTANTGSVPYRTVGGTPGATPTYFGYGLKTTATAKGSNMGCDAIRYGTGAYITAGDGTTPATFDGFATQNDSINNRWGILTAVGGGYELQGRFVVGQNNSKVATAAHFDDSNRVISIIDTPHSTTDFTQIIVDHASTVFNMTNVTILSLGTNNPGRLVFNNASTTAALTGCTFDTLGLTTLRAGVTADGCTWRTTDQITQNGATITNCFIENNSNAAAILSDAPNLISNTRFTSDGTGYAIEIDTPGTYTFTGNTFSGYAATDGTTGNECIFNNSSGAVTINVGGGGDTPTIRNGAGASTTVNNNKTVTFTGLKDNSEVRIYLAADGSVVDGIEDATAGTTDNRTFAWSASAGTVVDYVIHNWQPGVAVYESIRVDGYTVPANDTSIAVQQRLDRNAE